MTSVLAILIAVFAALLFAVSDVALRRALEFTTPVTATILTTAVQWLAFLLFFLVAGNLSALGVSGAAWFFLAGLLNPVIFLTLYFIGLKRVKVLRASPLKGASPLFAAFFAAVILRERLTSLQYLVIALVVAGVVIITLEQPENGEKEGGQRNDWRKPDLIFPVLAGVATGLSTVVFKIGLETIPSPLLGVWIGTTEGLLLLPLTAFLFPAEQRFRLRARAWPWLIGNGLTAAAGIYAFVYALDIGQVSVVSALVQISPLFILAASLLYLRRQEAVTPKVVVGALFTVAGGALVGLIRERAGENHSTLLPENENIPPVRLTSWQLHQYLP